MSDGSLEHGTVTGNVHYQILVPTGGRQRKRVARQNVQGAERCDKPFALVPQDRGVDLVDRRRIRYVDLGGQRRHIGVKERHAPRSRNRYTVVAVTDEVEPAELIHRNRRKRDVSLEGDGDSLPSGADVMLSGQKLTVEVGVPSFAPDDLVQRNRLTALERLAGGLQEPLCLVERNKILRSPGNGRKERAEKSPAMGDGELVFGLVGVVLVAHWPIPRILYPMRSKRHKDGDLAFDALVRKFSRIQYLVEQRAFADVVEKAPVGICITNRSYVYEYVNEAYCRIYGYAPEELVGKPFTMVVPEEHRKELVELHDQFMDQEYELTGEWSVRTKDGSQVTILASAVYVVDEKRNPKKITFVLDITARTRALVQLKSVQEDIESALQRLKTGDMDDSTRTDLVQTLTSALGRIDTAPGT
ncbi:MAG: PAS domain S-box protein [Spirochaetaceae bacterium]|nr:MAG: PAS domain S-box protein [Spirochaetaceae bacterium]